MYYHKKRLGCQYASIRASYPLYNASYRFADCGFLQQNGYESISTCCLSHIGIGDDWEPSGNFLKDIYLLPAIYVPMDGMNEKGLYIADSTGKAVAVEWVNNQMYVKETNVLTNHYVTESPKKDDGINEENGNSRLRLEKLAESTKAADGKMSTEEVAEVLKSVSAGQYGYDELTVWSAVFEPANQKISYFFKEKYENKVVLELKQN